MKRVDRTSKRQVRTSNGINRTSRDDFRTSNGFNRTSTGKVRTSPAPSNKIRTKNTFLRSRCRL